jgi:hypothetical protein
MTTTNVRKTNCVAYSSRKLWWDNLEQSCNRQVSVGTTLQSMDFRDQHRDQVRTSRTEHPCWREGFPAFSSVVTKSLSHDCQTSAREWRVRNWFQEPVTINPQETRSRRMTMSTLSKLPVVRTRAMNGSMDKQLLRGIPLLANRDVLDKWHDQS